MAGRRGVAVYCLFYLSLNLSHFAPQLHFPYSFNVCFINSAALAKSDWSVCSIFHRKTWAVHLMHRQAKEFNSQVFSVVRFRIFLDFAVSYEYEFQLLSAKPRLFIVWCRLTFHWFSFGDAWIINMLGQYRILILVWEVGMDSIVIYT